MAENAPRILIIEDEPQIRRFLRTSLSSQGYVLFEATTANEGLYEAASNPPDLVLLDLGLPDMDGLEVITRLREWMTAPIIIISARGQERDKVSALDSGADDYLTKPFAVGELMARLRVALRHALKTQGSDAQTIVEIRDLKIDLAKRLVFLNETELKLTPIEFKLLTLLVKHAGKVLTHRQISLEVWGPHFADENHSLRVFIHQLRQKIEADPAQPKYLITEAGVGYRLKE